MKPAAFDYVRPKTLAEAVSALAGTNGAAKLIAGAQSLGPMLNLRLAQPEILIDIARLPELARVEEERDAVTWGAGVTHAVIEDGRAPDPTNGYLRAVAAAIAYRAVRNRGTVGGSLAHADPAADWPTVLAAVGAEAVVTGPKGRRRIAVVDLALGPFETALADNEIIDGIRIPRFSPRSRFGFYKFCRKAGEMADAMCAILIDPERGLQRAVLGATHARPIAIEDASGILRDGFAMTAAAAAVDGHGLGNDPYERQLHIAAIRRCAHQVAS